MAMIYAPVKKGSKLGEMLPGLAETIDKEHKRLLARKSIIEKRKEEHERQLLEMVTCLLCDLILFSLNAHIFYSIAVSHSLLIFSFSQGT